MAENILIDSCYWISFFEPQKEPKLNIIARNNIEFALDQKVILPWPVMYETLNTRLARRGKDILAEFKKIIKNPKVELIDDNPYKDICLENFFDQHSSYSLVDLIIREMLKDNSLRINYLFTFNNRDFVDICTHRKINIWDT